MKITRTTTFTAHQLHCVFNLWNTEYPEQLVYKELRDFKNYLDGITSKRHLLIQSEEDALLAWGVVFTRTNERFFAIILATGFQRKGYGTLLLNELKKDEIKLSGWVITSDQYKNKMQNPINLLFPFIKKIILQFIPKYNFLQIKLLQ